MKTIKKQQEEKVFTIGQTVTWVVGKRNCEGIVRDDLGKETVQVTCINIDGRKACQKIDVKRELLKIKKPEKMSVKRQLLVNKLKKYSKKQLLDKIKKNNFKDDGDEKEVISEILLKRGCKLEDIIVEEISKVVEGEPENKKRFNNINEVEPPKEEKVEEIKRVEKKGKVLNSKEVEAIKSGVKVKFNLHIRRGGGEVSGVVSHIHLRKGNKEYILIKTDNGIVSKRPSALTIIS